MAAKKQKKPAGLKTLLIVIIIILAIIALYLNAENKKLRAELEKKDSQIGDLQIQLKLHETGTIK